MVRKMGEQTRTEILYLYPKGSGELYQPEFLSWKQQKHTPC